MYHYTLVADRRDLVPQKSWTERMTNREKPARPWSNFNRRHRYHRILELKIVYIARWNTHYMSPQLFRGLPL